MEKSFIKKHPVVMSFVFLFILIFCASLATSISQVFKMNDNKTMLIQTGGFIISAFIAILIIIKSKYSLQAYGIQLPKMKDIKGALWFIPLILVEGIVLIVGIEKGITPTDFIVIILWITAAVINEELYFRGLILKTLSIKGTSFAIIISSLFFGLAHLGNLFVGKSLIHSLLFVGFSALIGFIYAEIIVLTRSLLIPIMMHFIHNLIASVTAEASDNNTLIIVAVQCLVLLIYSIYLWKNIKRKEKELI